jgi:hypothetical protein
VTSFYIIINMARCPLMFAMSFKTNNMLNSAAAQQTTNASCVDLLSNTMIEYDYTGGEH